MDATLLQRREMKALLLQKQYRKCIALCRQMLESGMAFELLHRTYIQFYLALAHDELARAIHNFSQTKIPALSQAELLYQDVLVTLPSTHQKFCYSNDVQSNAHEDPFTERSPLSHLSLSTIQDDENRSLYMRSPPLTPYNHKDSLIPSPTHTSPSKTKDFDFDELESPESFADIMTPTRVPPKKLERDYSSMSLVGPQPTQMAQGLLRPIRLGEEAKRYHMPPQMPYAGGQCSPLRLPRLQTKLSLVPSSPMRKQLRTHSEEASAVASPKSPVSPLRIEESVVSDASTISSISPSTPTAEDLTPIFECTSISRRGSRTQANVKAMRIQLERHIALVRDTKQTVIDAQIQRTAARDMPIQQVIDFALMGQSVGAGRMQQSRSFWSFTTENTKAIEKQWRIQMGRQRGWSRQRFDPSRYRDLAERALSEL